MMEKPDNRKELSVMNQRLNHLEDVMMEIFESGREMDTNLTSQLEEVRHEIAMQHETIKKMKRSNWSRITKLTMVMIVVFTIWVIYLYCSI
jgi:hypothetical protein